MNLGIMQPYFFPFIGYFQLMNQVNTWVILDDVQFVNKGWVNRNRILHPDHQKEWQYITLPIDRRHRFINIKNIKLKDHSWKTAVLRKLAVYKKNAPYYTETIDFLESLFDKLQTLNLSKILEESLKTTACLLGITPSFYKQSELPDFSGSVGHPGQWALRISEYFRASTYINPEGGAEIFREYEFKKSNINLKFFRPNIAHYDQNRHNFIPRLSIIDIIMWNGLYETQKMAKIDSGILSS